MGAIRISRAYDPPQPGDGRRVLVDRLWPRGVRKDDLPLDEWAKAVAPSTELRRWFGHRPERWDEFVRRYGSELDEPEPAAALAALREASRAGTLTLVTATRDVDHSAAAVLANRLRG